MAEDKHKMADTNELHACHVTHATLQSFTRVTITIIKQLLFTTYCHSCAQYRSLFHVQTSTAVVSDRVLATNYNTDLWCSKPT